MPLLWATPLQSMSDALSEPGVWTGAWVLQCWRLSGTGWLLEASKTRRQPSAAPGTGKVTSDGEQVACAKPTNTLGQAGPASELSQEQPSQAAGHATELVHLGDHRPTGHSQAQLPALPEQPSTPQAHTGTPPYQEFCGGGGSGSCLGWPRQTH